MSVFVRSDRTSKWIPVSHCRQSATSYWLLTVRMVADSQGVATMHQLMSVVIKSDRIETDSSKCSKLMGLGFSG